MTHNEHLKTIYDQIDKAVCMSKILNVPFTQELLERVIRMDYLQL